MRPAGVSLGSSSALAVGFAGFSLLAILAPLASYAVALAVFGLPHVLSELRYIDRRFGRRLDRGLLPTIAMLLATIVAIRAATVFRLLPPALGVPAELSGVALLALACVRGTGGRTRLALAVAGTIGGATLLAPYGTAVTFSILHNLTPLGFLWQLAPRRRRGGVMGPAVAALLALPLLVATGWPRETLAGLGLHGFTGDPLGAGPLADSFFVYVPPGLIASRHAIDLFTASVVAQGGHYLAVILVLPVLLGRLDPRARGVLAWPAGDAFAGLCAGAAILSLAVFLHGFGAARGFYGIAASLHAWLEIPVLILALTGAAQPASQSPSSSDPVLAISETSIA